MAENQEHQAMDFNVIRDHLISLDRAPGAPAAKRLFECFERRHGCQSAGRRNQELFDHERCRRLDRRRHVLDTILA
jgi:hypothetical protein